MPWPRLEVDLLQLVRVLRPAVGGRVAHFSVLPDVAAMLVGLARGVYAAVPSLLVRALLLGVEASAPTVDDPGLLLLLGRESLQGEEPLDGDLHLFVEGGLAVGGDANVHLVPF